jgi:hypothetical protein
MAIYLVQPTIENFKLIKNDMDKSIFDNYYINFSNKCEDTLLNTFFSDLIQTNKYNSIYKITINPIGIFIYHPKVYSLNISNPYLLLNKPNVKEEDLNNYINQIGLGIFNSLFTLKTIPIIKYRTGWFAENIVSVIQSHFNQITDKFLELQDEFKKNNTLLIILDRDIDLPIMLHHASSLGAMISDVFGLSRSKQDNQGAFQIDPITDYIWNDYLTKNFIDVKEKIVEDMNEITNQTKFLDQAKANPDDVEQISEKLSSTLEGLRDITMKQTILSNHISFQDKLTDEIEKRNLGRLYQLEESLLKTRNFNKENKKNFLDLLQLKTLEIKDMEKSKTDLLRLSLIYYLTNPKISNEEVKEIERCLSNLGVKLDSLEYLKNKRNFEESLNKSKQPQQASGLLNFGRDLLIKQFNSLMTTEQPSITAEIINSLSTNKEITSFVSYDLIKRRLDKTNNNFTQVMVFLVGGGNLAEFEYVDELLSKNGKNVKYKLIMLGYIWM